MKNLRIPEKKDGWVNITDIDLDFEGIIIGYKNNQPVGFIFHYGNGWWTFGYTICIRDGTSETNLQNLIDILIDNQTCDSFKVIEFFNDENS